jgi:hypothetical protein
MTVTARRDAQGTRGRSRLFTWLTALSIGGALAPGGCSVDRDDHYELLRRREDRVAGEPTPLRYAAGDDASAARVRRLMSDELSGELLRTFAMARRLIAETAPASSVQRARVQAPAYVALGTSDVYRGLPYRDRALSAGLGQRAIPAGVPIVWVDDEPQHTETGRLLASQLPASKASTSDRALRDAIALDQIASGFGHAILSLIAPPPAISQGGTLVADDPLGEGYVTFLEVLDAEWRSAGGDRAAADARAVLQHAAWFAAVRGNQGIERYRTYRACGLSAASPSDTALAREPLVIATFLYRLAASQAGHRLAPDDTYRSMVLELPPSGFSPGRVLGPFRNFQAKLLWAWNRAALAGHRPRDLVDLVEAYADAFPAERPEVTRILLVTTYGLTVRPGGIPADRPCDDLESTLAALTADVLFGRLDLRAGFGPVAPSPRPL